MKDIKKTYMKPSMIVCELKSRQMLLTGSDVRYINYSDVDYEEEFD